VRKRGWLESKRIPVCQYQKTLKEELGNYSAEELLRIERDMLILRTFETALNEVKLRRGWKGIGYEHKGPAHLSIG